MSYHREGSDMMRCKECGDKFDLNDVQRTAMEVSESRYQPICPRCITKLNDSEGKGICAFCESKKKIEEMAEVDYVHDSQPLTETVLVCSNRCMVRYVRAQSRTSF